MKSSVLVLVCLVICAFSQAQNNAAVLQFETQESSLPFSSNCYHELKEVSKNRAVKPFKQNFELSMKVDSINADGKVILMRMDTTIYFTHESDLIKLNMEYGFLVRVAYAIEFNQNAYYKKLVIYKMTNGCMQPVSQPDYSQLDPGATMSMFGYGYTGKANSLMVYGEFTFK